MFEDLNSTNYGSSAPCYWELKDESGPWTCMMCRQPSPGKDMVFAILESGTVRLAHRACLEPGWLESAKKMEGKQP